MKHSEECRGTVEYKINGTMQISYCYECGWYGLSEIPCDHNWRAIRFKITNGVQIRKLCTKCYSITPQSEKKANYEGDTLPERNLNDYNDWLNSHKKELVSAFSSIIADMEKIKQINFNIERDDFREEYKSYLKSPEWKAKRDDVMRRDKGICQSCFSRAIEVHHWTYKHKGEELYCELVSLCSQCHRFYHDK